MFYQIVLLLFYICKPCIYGDNTHFISLSIQVETQIIPGVEFTKTFIYLKFENFGKSLMILNKIKKWWPVNGWKKDWLSVCKSCVMDRARKNVSIILIAFQTKNRYVLKTKEKKSDQIIFKFCLKSYLMCIQHIKMTQVAQNKVLGIMDRSWIKDSRSIKEMLDKFNMLSVNKKWVNGFI